MSKNRQKKRNDWGIHCAEKENFLSQTVQVNLAAED